MLDTIGLSETDLFDRVPASAFEYLWIGKTEAEIFKNLSALDRPIDNPKTGGGRGLFTIPTVVDSLSSRGEFVTSYTPYQPECSQGTLGAIFEFQTRVCEMTALEVSNAGLYDGSTACAEAIVMAAAETSRKKVVLSRTINPTYREVIRTLLTGRNLEFVELDFDRISGQTVLDEDVLQNAAAVLVQSPNAFGVIEAGIEKIFSSASRSGAIPVHLFHPLAGAVVGRSGDLGAEIAVADGQPLGIPLWGGGPSVGLIAARERFLRRMPGRIVGETTDRAGRPCYVLTLQTREQHIRRERATSNICTNQALIALRATIFLASFGWAGLAEYAARLHKITERQAAGRAIFSGPVFNEFTVRGDEGVWLDYPELGTVSVVGGNFGNFGNFGDTSLNSGSEFSDVSPKLGWEEAFRYRTESEIVRRFTRLSRMNFSVDAEFYPLGSCTMKHNPKICDAVTSLPGLRHLHPADINGDSSQARRLRRVLGELTEYLATLCGMESFSLAPAAGSHGELAACLMIRAFHRDRGATNRTKMLIPDSAHGTNPASAHAAGFDVITVRSTVDGRTDLEDLRSKLGPDIAGMMMTNPSTLGVFEPAILEICDSVHQAGGLMYYDGANLNAIVGKSRPGEMGFDLCHVNLHKTFAVPHGGGGPGAGPIGASRELAPYLPEPVYGGDTFFRPEHSIGKVIATGGNIAALVRAHTYITLMGFEGLRNAARDAVIAANYVRVSLKDIYPSQVSELPCAHECLLSAAELKREKGITAYDIAKALIEEGIHPPTIYFPVLVPEALLIEPTETETMETLDRFIAAMRRIATMSKAEIDRFPSKTPVSRPDEAAAARRPILRARA